ncbi:MAG: hypothetical protein ACOVSW_17770, partial [Candidatus Kapaibacteriota bacterium]
TSAYPMQVVTITGTNLSGASQVQFGGVNAAWYAVDSPTQIRAVVPITVVNGAVSVTTPAGTASQPGFTVAATPQVSTIAGDGTSGFLDAAGQAARLSNPRGVAIDGTGNLYIPEQGNNRIRKITPAGVVTTFAGTGVPGFADGPGASAQFNFPFGAAFDGSGNLYIGDRNNSRIRRITPLGVVSTFAGSGTQGFLNGAVASAQFNNPNCVTFDGAGDAYVADQQGYRIRKITAGTTVSTLAGSGGFGFMDGAGATAQFRDPHGVAVDALGNVYVADANNHRIRKITSAGVVSTLAGSGVAGFADGLGAAAQFNTPVGIALDASGNVYVADGSNHRIRKISPSGMVITIAGTGTLGFADGAAGVAQFNAPCAIVLDASGNLIVADEANHRIRKVEIYSYQYVSGDAGLPGSWRRLPGLVTPATDFTTIGSQFQVAPGATATATSSFTLGAGVSMTVMDNATLALANGVTMTNSGSLSIADGAIGGRLLLTGTGAVTGNPVGYAGANATLESGGGVAKTLSALELPNPMPGKLIIANTVGTTVPAATTLGATGTISVNAGARMIIPNGASVLNNNPSATSFSVQTGGILILQGTGQVAAGSASAVNYAVNSLLEYTGSAAKTTNAQEFPATMNGNLVITNTSPVTLDAAKTLGASATLTLTAGRIVTSAVNMLTVTNTAAAAVSATAGYVDGPLQRDMPASLAAPAVTYSFPVGVGATPYPFAIQNPTTGSPGPRLQMQAFTANAGGTAGASISLLSTTEYWQLQQINGNYTSGLIFLQKAGLTATNTIGGNPITPTGTYNGFTSSFGTGLTTVTPVTGTGCFLVGTGPIIYDWVGAAGADWQVAGNWSPVRTTPAPTDILRFNAGTHTPTNIPNQTIQQLIIGGDVTLPPVSVTLTVGVGGVQIATMRSLDLGANITLTQNAGGTVTVDGTLNTNASKVNGAGAFLLNASGTFATSNSDGFNGFDAITGAMQCSGTITYTAGANFTFAPTVVANTRFTAVAGKPAITNIATLTLNGTNTTTLDAGIAVSAATAVNSGTFVLGANTLTQGAAATMTIANGARVRVPAGGTISNGNASGTSFTVQNGGFLEIQNNGQVTGSSDVNYITGSTLEYSGTAAKTTTAREIGAAGVQQMLITNTMPVTLGANALIQQSLSINAASKLVLSDASNPTLTLNGTLNQNGGANIASVNVANAGSISLGGTNALTLRMDATDNTLNNFTVNRSGNHTITGDVNVRGTLDLQQGILEPSTRIFSGDPTGTAPGVITGGGANSYVRGALERRFAGGIVANGTNYAFPIGSAAGFRGATLLDVKTGASPVVRMNVADAGAVTADMTLTALFGARNWRVQTISGVFNGSAIALTESGLTSSNVVARSVAQGGAYTRVGGSAVTPTVTSDPNAVPSGANHYFAVGSVQPVITSISPTTVAPGDTLTITGVSLGAISSVGIGSVPAVSFQIVSNTQLRVVVGQGASGRVVLISPTGVVESVQSVTFFNAPIISTFVPTYGTTGSTVRITGSRLSPVSAVSFGGLNALSFTGIDAGTVDAVVNLGYSGPVTLQTPSGIAASQVPFEFILKPSIVNFFPKWARARDTVSIVGGNFQRASGVKFAGTNFIESFRLVTNGQIRIAVPENAATGMIRVQNPVGTDSSWINFTFTGQPRVTFVQPNRIVGIGQPLTITGAEFHPVPTVMIGAVTAASVEWTDLTLMKATFTQATTGLLTIIASGGTVTLPTPIQVIPPPIVSGFTPLRPSPGDVVSVSGANFVPGAVSISIGGVPVPSISVLSSTRLTFVVPPALSGPISISAPGGISSSSGATLGIVQPPFISDASGITTATIGQTLILRGSGFLNIVGVNIGGRVASTFATLDSIGTRLSLRVPLLIGLDSAAREIQTTEASIGVLTRSGAATYTMLFRNRALSPNSTSGTSTTATSTSGTMQNQAVMQITSVSPVNLPEDSDVTLQGIHIATTATVWMRTAETTFASLSIMQQSTTALVVRIPDGTVPPLLLSTQATLLVSSATRQITVPFSLQIQARNIPQFVTFQPITGNTRAVISIVGQNFAPLTNTPERGSVRVVSIGGVPVESFRVVSPNLIQATVGLVRSGIVRVETASGALLSAQEFTLDTATTIEVIPPEPVISKDSLALNRLFAATQGMRWTTSTNWTNNSPIAFRFGIKVQSGRVVEVRLPRCGLQGVLPPDILGDLDGLRALDVSGNALVGAIPQEITNAKNLEALRLAGNRFAGRLPQNMCALTKLREVDLSGNRIADSLASLACLPQLTVLNLRGNAFVGGFPSGIEGMRNLSILDLSGNAMTGALPESLGDLTQLTVLNLRGNRFTGGFPTALGRLAGGGKQAARTAAATELAVVDLGENGFTGTIPAEVGNLINLRTLLLDGNRFTGALPSTLTSLARLRRLDVARN